ncbi:hypothetical protein AX660_03800 [Paraglaciecola hydrolytica]|uniref:Orphan protein n=2 Tax=Paraglaciecola hydrolytica TaxID=1799789 RepID=A0A148KKW7_9ALTE|nr:hypothetical protein [Paraglaciecola hydrolytica]KXI26898.1 hypothetical protein AX660_03800 [Paraglaciecola hydrolytica]
MQDFANSEQEKIALEHQAAKLFMRWYEHDTNKPIRHLWHNQPSKPDVSCRFEGQRLDLEIAHLYGSEQEAMAILGRDLSEQTRAELRELVLSSEPDQRLLRALNRILLNKSLKQYKTKRVWLIIRNAHPAWDKTQIAALQGCIDVPQNHPFEQIWIVGDWQGKTGIVQLYPN